MYFMESMGYKANGLSDAVHVLQIIRQRMFLSLVSAMYLYSLDSVRFASLKDSSQCSCSYPFVVRPISQRRY